MTLTPGEYQLSTAVAAKAWTMLWLLGVKTARTSSLPFQVILLPGKDISPFPLTPNPQFFEALMGWPTGWTVIDSQGTESFPWRLAMRLALSRLLQEKS